MAKKRPAPKSSESTPSAAAEQDIAAGAGHAATAGPASPGASTMPADETLPAAGGTPADGAANGGGATESILYLDATLEIGQVEEARRQLLELLDGASTAAVDVSRLSSVDTAGIQVLIALRLEAAQRGTPLEFRGKSAALNGALALLGLENALSPAAEHVG